MGKLAGSVGIEIRASTEKMRADLAQARRDLQNLGITARTAGSEAARGMAEADVTARKLGKGVAEALLAIEGAHAALSTAVTRYGAGLLASGAASDHVVNSYRALRLALSPTPFTVATVATGILVEETIKLVNARAKLIEQQALISASTRTPISIVERLDTTSNLSGVNPSTVRSLYSTLQSRNQSNASEVQAGLGKLGVSGGVNPDALAKIASAFSSIEDPVKRADAAVLLFGSDAGTALTQLNATFAASDRVVKEYGLVLDGLSRTQIYNARQEFVRFRAAISDWSEVKGFGERFKTDAEIVAAAAEDMAKRGARALDGLISRYVPGMAALRAALHGQETLSPAELAAPGKRFASQGQRIAADDLFAEYQDEKARHDQTIEGLRERASTAEVRSRDARNALDADAANRTQNQDYAASGIKPPNVLMTDEQRSARIQEQQSAQQLAASLLRRIEDLESRQKTIASDLRASAAGAGYAAKRSAEIEPQVSSAVADKGANADEVRSRLTAEYDARHRAEVADNLASLKQQIELENTEASVRTWGTDAVERAALELRLHRIAVDNDVESAGRLIKAERELYTARKNNADQAKLTGLTNEIAGIRKVSQAGPQGEAAVHEAELQNRLDELKRAGASADVIAAEREKDETEQAKERLKILTSIVEKTEELNRLTQAVPQGDAAVAAVKQAQADLELIRAGKGDLIRPSHELTDAEKAHEAAKKAKEDADTEAAAVKELTQELDFELAAQKRLSAAIGQGSQAERLAELQTRRLRERGQEVGNPSLIDRQKQIDDIETSNEIARSALAAGGSYQDQLRVIGQQFYELNKIKVTDQNINDIELARLALTQKAQEVEVQRLLGLGTLKDGWSAFFIEMEERAEQPGQILFDGMNSALDKVSDNLSKLMSGQKTSWANAFKMIGGEMEKASIKSALHTGLGSLGKTLGIDLTGSQKQDGQTQGRAIWVQSAASSPGQPGQAATDPTTGLSSKLPELLQKVLGLGKRTPRVFQGDQGGGVFNLLDTPRPNRFSRLIDSSFSGKPDGTSLNPFYVVLEREDSIARKKSPGIGGTIGTIFKDFGLAVLGAALGGVAGGSLGGSTESVSSSISYEGARAMGGPVSAGSAYWVGEHGPEMVVPTTSAMVMPNDSRPGGDVHYYTIDARGTDPVLTEQRVKAAIIASHNSAVATSVQASVERTRRVPTRA